MHVAHHAEHIGLGAAAMSGVDDDVSLGGELTEQRACEDVLVEEVPRAAVQVNDDGAGALDARRWLPDVGEELAIGAGNRPEGHVALPSVAPAPGAGAWTCDAGASCRSASGRIRCFQSGPNARSRPSWDAVTRVM